MALNYDLPHDLDLVFNTLTDPDFLVDRCLAMGELSAECEVEVNGGIVTVTMTREIQRQVPRVLRKIFGNVQVTEYIEEWRRARDGWAGNWTLTVQGQPVTVTADFALKKTRTGCRYNVSHHAEARIPVVGRQIEKFILSQTTDGATQELDFLRDFLAE